jgi:hypothetical protein
VLAKMGSRARALAVGGLVVGGVTLYGYLQHPFAASPLQAFAVGLVVGAIELVVDLLWTRRRRRTLPVPDPPPRKRD